MKKILIIMTSLVLLLASCNRDDSHIIMPRLPTCPEKHKAGLC